MQELEKIKENYREVREDYHSFIDKLDYSHKETLFLFETRFNRLLGNIALLSEDVFRLRTIHDDKSATAKKATIIKRLNDSGVTSFSKCESFAAADEEYLQFLKNRSTWYGEWEALSQIKTSLEHYLREIAHRTKEIRYDQ